jgi:formamidopyrimidine-DNA glycosylase
MPELPEVERARQRLDRAVTGRVISRLRLLHPALARRVGAIALESLAGARITGVDRRGKHQLIRLEDGRTLHAHFRMTGDWTFDRDTDPLPRFARAELVLDDGTRVILDDPRALSTIDIHAPKAEPELGLGPEPMDAAFTVTWLRQAFGRRRGPIKPVLLDQRLVAGLGNIYAVEALWTARIAPTVPAQSLTAAEVVRLRSAIVRVIARATGARYGEGAGRFAVYDRAGKRCRRCGSTISRIVQAGRSTYFCPGCQQRSGSTHGTRAGVKRKVVRRRGVNRGPRSARP